MANCHCDYVKLYVGHLTTQSFIVKSRVKSTAEQLHNPQSLSDTFSFHHVDGRQLHKMSCCQSVCSVCGGVHSGKYSRLVDQEENMQSIFAKNGSETPEPVKAQVKGQFDGIGVRCRIVSKGL